MDNDDMIEREWDEWDYEDDTEDSDLDPGFASWDDYYRYMYS